VYLHHQHAQCALLTATIGIIARVKLHIAARFLDASLNMSRGLASHLEVSEAALQVGYFVDPHWLPTLREARHPVHIHALGKLIRWLRLLQYGVDALLTPPLLYIQHLTFVKQICQGCSVA
jgi:hypothetical protein